MRGTLQGTYSLQHPEKYIGNTSTVIYRSSWERKFFVYCDTTPGVLKWAAEEFHIPYVSPVDGRLHKYFPDVYLEVAGKTGKQYMVIEIKPEKQTTMPIKRKRQTSRTFLNETATVAVNHAKWAAAEEYCAHRGWKFLVLTEKHLFANSTKL